MAWPSVTVTGGPSGGQFQAGTGSFNLAHTCAAGDTKLVLLIGTGATGAGDFITGVTYNGAAFTKSVNQTDGSFERVNIWTLDSPTTGSAFNIVISYATGGTSTQFGYGAISFDSAAATMGAASSAAGSTANPTVTVADSASGDIVISVVANDNAANAQSVNTGTVIFDAEDVNTDSDFTAQYQTATGANTVCTFTQSDTTGGSWVIAGVAIKSAAPTGPTINTQPVSQRVPAGTTASFSVTATASGGSLTYQWQDNTGGTFANISGETASSYTTGTLIAGTAYAVRCVVNDSNGPTTTNPADVWTPVTEPAFWSGVSLRGGGKDYLRAYFQVPQSGMAAAVFDSALWGAAGGGGSVISSGAVSAGASQAAGGAQAIASAAAVSAGVSAAVATPIALAARAAIGQAGSQAVAPLVSTVVLTSSAVGAGGGQAVAAANAIAARAAIGQAASQAVAGGAAVASAPAVSQGAAQAVSGARAVVSAGAVSQAASQAAAPTAGVVVITSSAVSAGSSQATAAAKVLASAAAVAAGASQAVASLVSTVVLTSSAVSAGASQAVAAARALAAAAASSAGASQAAVAPIALAARAAIGQAVSQAFAPLVVVGFGSATQGAARLQPIGNSIERPVMAEVQRHGGGGGVARPSGGAGSTPRPQSSRTRRT